MSHNYKVKVIALRRGDLLKVRRPSPGGIEAIVY